MSNTLTTVIPKLLAAGLLALREQAFMPQIVNRKYETMAGQRGSTIDIPIPSAIATQDVTPAATPPVITDISPTSVSILLNKWKYSDFGLSDKEQLEVMEGTIPMQATEAIKGLANTVNNDIFALYKDIYGYTGTAGTTPFVADTSDAANAMTILNQQLAPPDDREFVLDPLSNGNAVQLRAFQDTSWSGTPSVIEDAKLQRKLGFRWWMHQLAPQHTAGTAAAATVTTAVLNALGATTVTLKVSASTATLVVGDIISFAGHSQTYVVTAAATLDTTGVAVTINPGLAVAVDGSGSPVAVTVRASHRVNLAFHRDAFAFVTRPIERATPDSAMAIDPVSGLALRLSLNREWMRVRYVYDILYGCKTIRAQYGVRLAG